MFFRKKGKLRKEFDQLLIIQLEQLKSDWNHQKSIIEKSVEPSEETLNELRLLEAKYLFLLRQAKARKVSFTQYK